MPWRTWPTLRIITRTSRWATTSAEFATAPTPSAGCPRTTSSAQRSSTRFPGCELRGLPERVADEEAFQQRAAIGHTQRATRQRRQRPDALCQHPVEGIDREFHELILALAPTLVLAQRALRAQLLPRGARRQAQLRQRRRIQHPQVHSLTGQWVHDMRRIPHQRAALGDITLRGETLQ